MLSHESKANVDPLPYTKIVAAYGLRKCSKLVEQVADEDIEVRVNALAVVCNEFHNPYTIQGCVEAGIIPILGQMISDPDFCTRERASKALAIAAADALGINAILENKVIDDILKGCLDPTVEVRSNIYLCIYHVTRIPDGIDVCVAGGAPSHFVKAVIEEDIKVQPLMLKTIQNLVRTHRGLTEVSYYNGVKVCISLLNSTNEDVQIESAKALGVLCFSDKQKDEAIVEGGVPALIWLLSGGNSKTKSAVTTALMAITSVDEGKRQMLPSGGIPVVMQTLINETDRIILINTLKLISNCAVYPQSRNIMVSDEACLTKLQDLAEGSTDPLMKKHATISLNAVNFKP